MCLRINGSEIERQQEHLFSILLTFVVFYERAYSQFISDEFGSRCCVFTHHILLKIELRLVFML